MFAVVRKTATSVCCLPLWTDDCRDEPSLATGHAHLESQVETQNYEESVLVLIKLQVETLTNDAFDLPFMGTPVSGACVWTDLRTIMKKQL